MTSKRTIVKGHTVLTHAKHGIEAAAKLAYDTAEFYLSLGFRVRVLSCNKEYLVLWSNQTIEPRIEVC